MEVFGFGNSIKIDDPGYGFIRVKKDGKTLFVSRSDVVEISESYGKLLERKQRKLSFEEVRTHLTEEFGVHRIRIND
jgi:ribosomal protein L24E